MRFIISPNPGRKVEPEVGEESEVFIKRANQEVQLWAEEVIKQFPQGTARITGSYWMLYAAIIELPDGQDVVQVTNLLGEGVTVRVPRKISPEDMDILAEHYGLSERAMSIIASAGQPLKLCTDERCAHACTAGCIRRGGRGCI